MALWTNIFWKLTLGAPVIFSLRFIIYLPYLNKFTSANYLLKVIFWGGLFYLKV